MSENKLCGFKSDSISSDTIITPTYLKKILIEWSKAAIRTYPSDITLWSAIYFRMKANGENPPMKPYLDPPDLKLGPGGLTPNYLKALAITLSNESEPYEKIEKMWEILSLEKKIFLEIIQIGKFDKYINPKHFIGISAAYLNNSLRDTMVFLCDIFSNDSNGILLDYFVSIYRFLAKLNCADESDQSSFILEPEETKKNLEESALSNVSQSLRSPSLTNSYIENESSGNVIDDDNFFDTESARGIPYWTDKIDEPESITDMLNDPSIEPPMKITVCDDPNFLLTLKQLKHNSNSDDLLSLLSDSSMSDSNQSIVTFVSSIDAARLSPKSITNVEERENEETMSEVYLKYEDFNFEEEDANGRSDEDIDESIIQEKTSVKSNETGIAVKYEDNENVTDIKMDGYNNDTTNIEVNKNFIVMLALVNNENMPPPNPETLDNESENTENESSAESEFSLLEKTELNYNTAEQIDDNKINNPQTFDENYFINAGKESSESEKSSDSEVFHYSEIDQQSDVSIVLENNSMLSASSSEIGPKDNGDQLLLQDGLYTSMHFEHMEVCEEFELNDDILDENEEHQDLSKISSTLSMEDQSLDAETCVPEEICLFVLPGVGPAIAEKQIERVITWVTKCASRQNNCVQQHNLLHFLCPPLDHKSMISFNCNMDTI